MANCSAPAKVSSGVPQGTVPGPLMLLISDIGDGIYSNLRSIAYDSLLYLAMETPNDAAQRQNDFRTNCHSGQPSGRLSFNTHRLGNRTQFSIQYEINSKKTLEALESHPYLGVELTSSLNWNKHAEKVIVKANRSLGFVKRNLRRCPDQVKVEAYSTVVRPHLEYASSVWSPHQKHQINSIETVQRKEAHFCKNCSDGAPSTGTRLIQELNREPLQMTRERGRLMLFFKISRDMMTIPMPWYVQPPPYSRTRQ